MKYKKPVKRFELLAAHLRNECSTPELDRLAIADCSIIPFAAASVNMSNLPPITRKSRPCGREDDEQITLHRESRQGSLQDSPPTTLHVRAWSQASRSKAPGRRARPFLRPPT